MLRNFSHSMESKEGRERNKAETKQDSKELTIMYHVFRCHVAESQQPQFERDSSGGFCSDWRFVDSVVLSTAPSEGKGASQGLHVGLLYMWCTL